MSVSKKHLTTLAVVSPDDGLFAQQVNYGLGTTIKSLADVTTRHFEDYNAKFNEDKIFDGFVSSQNGDNNVDVSAGNATVKGLWIMSTSTIGVTIPSGLSKTYYVFLQAYGDGGTIETRNPLNDTVEIGAIISTSFSGAYMHPIAKVTTDGAGVINSVIDYGALFTRRMDSIKPRDGSQITVFTGTFPDATQEVFLFSGSSILNRNDNGGLWGGATDDHRLYNDGNDNILDIINDNFQIDFAGTPKYTFTSSMMGLTGSLIVSGTSNLIGAVSVSGAVLIDDNVAVSGTLEVNNGITFNETLLVYGNASFSGTMLIDETLTVWGNTGFSGTLDVIGTSGFSGAMLIDDTLNVLGATTLGGNLTLAGNNFIGTGYILTSTELGYLEDLYDTGVTAVEYDYLDGVSSNIQTQIGTKAPIADPTFTGEIGIGAVNVSETELGILEGATLSTAELNFVDGVGSAIQTQIDTKAPIDNPTFTGEIGIGAVNISETELGILEGATLSTAELNYVDGVSSAIQTQMDTKAPIADPTFTGELGLEGVNVSEAELGLLEGAVEGANKLQIGDVLIQWGSGSPTGGQLDVTFPVAYTSTPSAQVNSRGGDTSSLRGRLNYIGSISTTSLTIQTRQVIDTGSETSISDGEETVHWLAIGINTA